jgi:hypothetical protein
MPAPTINYTATNIPAVQVLPAYVSLKTVYNLAAFPPASKRILPGAPQEFVAKLNQNAHAHDYTHRYGAGQGIGAGYDITSVTGLTAQIALGQCVIDGLVDNPVNISATIIDNSYALSPYGRVFLWLQSTGDGNPGNIIQVINSLTPPAGNPCVYLGSVKTNAGAIVEIDVSGVFYKRAGVPWRQTADTDMPGDTPPANLAFLTKTLGGLWLWDGTSYVKLGSSGTSPALAIVIRYWEGFTPVATGPDGMVIRIPYDPADGIGTLTFDIRSITFRVEVPGSTTSTVLVETSPGGGVFTPTTLDTLSLASGVYEVTHTGSLATVQSGYLLRANVSAIGTGAANWLIDLMAQKP